MGEAIKQTTFKTRMSLWKAFEFSRKSGGHRDGFVEVAGSGQGSTLKKRKLLTAWEQDGGKTKKHFNQAALSYKAALEQGFKEGELGQKNRTGRTQGKGPGSKCIEGLGAQRNVALQRSCFSTLSHEVCDIYTPFA